MKTENENGTNGAAWRLSRQGDQLFLESREAPGQTAVTAVWLRPVTGRGAEVAFVDAARKEVLTLSGLSELDSDSRALAEEELKRNYLVSRITRVQCARSFFGTQYWDVETDLGPRRVAIKSDNCNAVWVGPDHLVLRDTLGCRHEINPYSALDPHSRAEIDKVM